MKFAVNPPPNRGPIGKRPSAHTPGRKRSEIAGSVGCRCGSSLLAEAAPRWNSRMGSCAPRIQPSFLREDRIAARLARLMYRCRDCHEIGRLDDWPFRIIHSDGGIDIRFRDPRPDHAHSSRSASCRARREYGSDYPASAPRALTKASQEK